VRWSGKVRLTDLEPDAAGCDQRKVHDLADPGMLGFRRTRRDRLQGNRRRGSLSCTKPGAPASFRGAYARLSGNKSERSFVRFPQARMQLKDIAYARSGDKGDTVNVGVLALDDGAYQKLLQTLTPERIKR